MLDFHEKRKLKSWIYSKPTAAILFLIALWISISVFDLYSAEREAAERRAERAEELRELESRASVLESKVERLQSERGIEEEIRDRFEVAKKGEEVVVIIGDNHDADETSDDVPEHKESIFQKLKFWD